MDPVNLSLKVPAIEKLIDYGASGVGAIAGLLLAPAKASREGKARLEAARIDAKVRLIEAESEATTSAIIAKARSDAQEYLVPSDAEVRGTVAITRDEITQSFEFQARKRLTNVRSVLEAAADELEDKEVHDHDPDPDWTARFFDSVQDVSSEDMQTIWAKILAGEVESPGRTSLRTLDTLKDMTKRDAELFNNICQFVIRDGFVFYDDLVKSFDGLNYGTLLHLQDCGLLNVGPFLSINFDWNDSRELVMTHNGGALLVTGDQEGAKVLTVPSVILSASGRELFRFARCSLHLDYLRVFSKFLKSKHCGLEYLENVRPLPDGRLWYANRIPIDPKSDQPEGPTQ